MVVETSESDSNNPARSRYCRRETLSRKVFGSDLCLIWEGC